MHITFTKGNWYHNHVGQAVTIFTSQPDKQLIQRDRFTNSVGETLVESNPDSPLSLLCFFLTFSRILVVGRCWSFLDDSAKEITLDARIPSYLRVLLVFFSVSGLPARLIIL